MNSSWPSSLSLKTSIQKKLLVLAVLPAIPMLTATVIMFSGGQKIARLDEIINQSCSTSQRLAGIHTALAEMQNTENDYFTLPDGGTGEIPPAVLNETLRKIETIQNSSPFVKKILKRLRTNLLQHQNSFKRIASFFQEGGSPRALLAIQLQESENRLKHEFSALASPLLIQAWEEFLKGGDKAASLQSLFRLIQKNAVPADTQKRLIALLEKHAEIFKKLKQAQNSAQAEIVRLRHLSQQMTPLLKRMERYEIRNLKEKRNHLYKIRKETILLSITFSFILVLFAVLLAYTIASRMSRTIVRLAEASRAIASGNLAERIKISTHDELGELAESFNMMAAELKHALLKRDEEIKDHKHTNLVLKREKDKAELIYQLVPSAIFTVDPNKRIASWNRRAAEITGYSESEVLGQPCALFSLSSCAENCALFSDKVLKPIRAKECTLRTKTGDLRKILINGDLIKDDQGRMIGGIESFEDITERKNLEEIRERYRQNLEGEVKRRTETLVALNKQLQVEIEFRKEIEQNIYKIQRSQKALLDNVPDMAWLKDKDSKFLAVNQAFALICGTHIQEIEGKTDYDFFDQESAKKFRFDDEEVIRTGRKKIVQEYIPSHDGTTRWFETVKTPIISESGEVIGTTGIARDITMQKQIEENLRKSTLEAIRLSKIKDEFLANISHEIRTPLNSIIGFTEAILVSENPQEIHQEAQIVLNESEILLQLINHILDHAKIEAGKIEIYEAPFHLRSLVDRIASATSQKARQKNLDFQTFIGPSVPDAVIGDELRIRQVLVNLVSNAIKFTRQGFVHVSVECLSQSEQNVRLKFTIQDSGIGIPSEKQHRVFQSYMQVDGSTTREFGGTGLGTNISKKIIQLMDGEIDFTSEPDKGSTFWFILTLKKSSLPASKETKAEDNKDTLQFSGTALMKHILLVEDYEPNQKLASYHLRQTGINFEVEANGETAVQACKNKKYDLIFMDVQMPVKDGYEATRQIRAECPFNKKTPIVAMTANADEASQQACLAAGMNDILIKPIRHQTFFMLINKWIEGADLAVQKEEPETPALSDPDAPLDYAKALSEFNHDEKLFKGLLKTFLTNLEKQIQVIADNILKQNREAVRSESHKIRGAAGSLAAGPLAQTAEELEKCARTESMNGANEIFSRMKIAFSELKEYVQKWDMRP